MRVASVRQHRFAPARAARWAAEPGGPDHTGKSQPNTAEIVALRGVTAAPDRRRGDRILALATALVSSVIAATLAIAIAPSLLRDPVAPTVASAEILAKGAQGYAAACAGCHGAALQGGAASAPAGAASATGAAPPPLDATGHAWLHSDAELFRIVSDGLANCRGEQRGAAMPGFAGQVGEDAIRATLAYIKSRWPAELQQIQAALNDGGPVTQVAGSRALCTPLCRPMISAATTLSPPENATP